nr:MAG TPA: hypothetical protein [Caudoviricetes sp.]
MHQSLNLYYYLFGDLILFFYTIILTYPFGNISEQFPK